MAEFFINFSRYIDEDSPVKIRMIGETQQEDSVNEERRDSDIMALEYIVSGEGILEIDGKTYYPKVGDVFFLKKGSHHKYSSSKKNGWHKIWVVFEGRLMEEMVDIYLPTVMWAIISKTYCTISKISKTIIKNLRTECPLNFLKYLPQSEAIPPTIKRRDLQCR